MQNSLSDFGRTPSSRRLFLSRSVTGLMAGVTTSLMSRGASAETRLAARISSETHQNHVLGPAYRMAADGTKALESVKDYTATLIRKERNGKKLEASTMELKLRHEPFSVYLKFIEPSAGREVIYVAGQNGGNLLVHETGFKALAGTLSLDPTGSLAMSGNRYPITMTGLRHLTETVIEKWLAVADEPGLKVTQYPNATIGTLSCRAIETVLANPVKDLPYQTVRLYFDARTNIPVRIQTLAFAAKPGATQDLIEDYHYSGLKTNVGLTDLDFDTKNPKYNF